MVSPRSNTNKRKDVQIIIHGSAEYIPGDVSAIDFDDFVNDIFIQNQASIKALFAEKSLSYKSALKDLRFDSVEKQIR